MDVAKVKGASNWLSELLLEERGSFSITMSHEMKSLMAGTHHM